MKIPTEFKRLFDNDWREAAIYGGRYSLKSHTVGRFLLIRARQTKTRVACFREFQSSIAESSHQLLKDLVNQFELTDFEITDHSIVNRINGSDFLFKGLYNNEQSIKSIEGVDIAWVEEAQAVTTSSLEVLTPTIRKEGSQIIYTYNRFLEEDPVHKRLVIEGRPNTLVINVNYDIAIKYNLLPVDLLREIEDDKLKRPSLYRHKWLGEPNSTELKIYSNWQQIDDVPKESRLERRYLDYGYTNDPTAIGDIYKWNDSWVIDEQLYQSRMLNNQISDFIKNLPVQIPVAADSAEPKSNDELALAGITIIPARKGKDSVNSGIQLVQQQKIFVTRRSKNIWKEYLSYLWMTDKDGKTLNVPIGTWNHHMDGIRYGFESLLSFVAPDVVRAQVRHFERVMGSQSLNSTK